MVKTVASVLREAARLVTMGHAKGWFARDEDGCATDALDQDATCWCAMGAMQRAAGGDPILVNDAIDATQDALGFRNLARFNDDRETTPAMVAALLSRAAHALEDRS